MQENRIAPAALIKVPQLTIWFWIIKIARRSRRMSRMSKLPRLNPSYWMLMLLCTTMGELIGNLLSRNFELGYAQGAIIDICVYATLIFLFLSFKLRHDIFYWILILTGNIGGTNLADWVTLEPLENDRKWGFLKPLQLGTKMGSLTVMGALILVLFIRYLMARRRGENGLFSSVFYWAAILLSSTFGTTSGDFITNDTPLGALGGSLFLLALLGVLYAAYKKRWLRQATAYWTALVLMHPICYLIVREWHHHVLNKISNAGTGIARPFIFLQKDLP